MGGIYGAYRFLKRTKVTDPPVEVKLEQTNLPIVMIDTKGKKWRIRKNGDTEIEIKIIYNGNDEVNYFDTIVHKGQTFNYDGKATIHFQGHTSLNLPKKSYTIELTDDSGEKRKEKLLGMKKSSKWCLRAVYIDGSLMRDALTMMLARPYIDYAPNMKYCELVIDGKYNGVYLLSEKVSRDRVGVKKSEDSDDRLRGGYMLEKDHLDLTFYSNYPSLDSAGVPLAEENVRIYVEYPKQKKLTEEQLNYIKEDFAKTEDAIESGDYAQYSQLVDVDNFVMYFLLNEFASNSDSYRMSFKIYKSKGVEKYRLAPWDFDYSYGNASRVRSYVDTWWYEGKFIYKQAAEYPIAWFTKLMQDSVLRTEVKEKWAELRAGQYSNEHIMHVVDSLYRELTQMGAMQRNVQAWNLYDVPRRDARKGSSFDEEVAFLKLWITARLAFMDAALLNKKQDDEIISNTCKQVGRMILYNSN